MSELARILQKESVLWEQPRKVSQQALFQRLTSLPADLFLKILQSILTEMQERWFRRSNSKSKKRRENMTR
ncbi:MAG: hypothetical protein L6461_03515 [Anaerolineae bacterium]|nr:hypothetical protein [Anaerolineae bacterium]